MDLSKVAHHQKDQNISWRTMLPFQGVSRRKRAIFYTQLSQMLESGVPPLRSLTIMAEQKYSGKLLRATKDMKDHIQSGGTLASALALHTHLFPVTEVRMLEAAEHAGSAPQIMKHLASFLLWLSNTIRGTLVRMIYPFMLLFVAFVFIPVFKAMFLGGIVNVLQQITWNIIRFFVYIFLIAFLWRISTSLPMTRYLLHAFLLRIPIVGNTVTQIARARFSNALECLYTAGVSMPEAVSRAAMGCGNEVISRQILRTAPLSRKAIPS